MERLEIMMMILKFQSTLPRRERHLLGLHIHRFLYFNPRSREGSDVDTGNSLYRLGISIHAPAKGATKNGGSCSAESYISIHAPAKGATAIFHKIINLYCETSTNTTRINSLNINKKYINRIKARILNYFFGANHLINLCKLYIRTCDL